MFKKMLLMGTLLTMLTANSFAFAEDVWTSPNGKKYHKEICRLLKNKDAAIKHEKADAVNEGFTPCKKCYKEDLGAEQNSK